MCGTAHTSVVKGSGSVRLSEYRHHTSHGPGLFVEAGLGWCFLLLKGLIPWSWWTVFLPLLPSSTEWVKKKICPLSLFLFSVVDLLGFWGLDSKCWQVACDAGRPSSRPEHQDTSTSRCNTKIFFRESGGWRILLRRNIRQLLHQHLYLGSRGRGVFFFSYKCL